MSPSAAIRCWSVRLSRAWTPGGQPPVAERGHLLRDLLALHLSRLQERRAELLEGVEPEVSAEQVVAQRPGRDVLGHELDRPA